MAKFPILEWKEIDGVNTPFAYPQHKRKDGSFVVTGENDPLPVAGYGMTDNGIWIPKRVNDDGSVNTQLTGSNMGKLAKAGLESVIFQRNGEMEGKVDEVIVDVDGECVLESLTIGANTNTARIMVFPKDSQGNTPGYLRIPHPDGSRLYSVQPLWLNRASGENDFFSLHKYDTENNEFIIAMKRVATFANGVQIRIGNQSNESKNISCNIMISRKWVG